MSIGMTSNPDSRYMLRPEYEAAYDLTVTNSPTFNIGVGNFQIDGTAVGGTAAELNVLDGVTAGTAAVSKAVVLDSSGDLIALGVTTNSRKAGTAGTSVTKVEYSGDGVNYTTVLTLTSVAITVGDSATLGVGVLIYTFPAGALIINSSYSSVGLTLSSGTPTNDQPDSGLGTVIAVGVVSNLSTPATFEDIQTGTAAADIAGTALVRFLGPTANGDGFLIAAGDAHTVHYNVADAWADVSVDGTATLSGTVALNWTWLHA